MQMMPGAPAVWGVEQRRVGQNSTSASLAGDGPKKVAAQASNLSQKNQATVGQVHVPRESHAF